MTTLCECGCGLPAPIATATSLRHGRIKGQPCRFRLGHHTRPSPDELYRVSDDSGCWMWQGTINNTGYGVYQAPKRKVLAHRLMYERARGPVPEDRELDHLCRNPACVNPDHLEAVTHLENVRRGAKTLLTQDQVRDIRRRAQEASAGRRRRPKGFVRSLAVEYGVGHTYMKRILAGTVRDEAAA